MQISIFTISPHTALILSTLIALSTSQLLVTNPGCSAVFSLEASCSNKFPQYLSLHTAPPLSIQVCVCYDANNSYQPLSFENGVNSCYSALKELPASAFSDDIYQINGGTKFPEMLNELYSGFCGRYATYGAAPATATSTGVVVTTTGGVSKKTCTPGGSCRSSSVSQSASTGASVPVSSSTSVPSAATNIRASGLGCIFASHLQNNI